MKSFSFSSYTVTTTTSCSYSISPINDGKYDVLLAPVESINNTSNFQEYVN